MKKWDAKRGIQRDQVYKKLSIQRKEDLLSKIALTTFEQGDYFFKQKAAEQYITDYIRNLPDANADPEALQLDSEVVLRSIEYQHGLLVERAKAIYSFSHLTFHEYFTAREIVFGTQPLEERLQNLVSHITEKRWREVFFLGVGMSPNADRLLLLMKRQVDMLIAANEKLQDFLIWLKKKSCSINFSYKSAAVRAFYFDRTSCYYDENYLELAIDRQLSIDLEHNLQLVDEHSVSSKLVVAPDIVLDFLLSLDETTDAVKFALDSRLKEILEQLNGELPYSSATSKERVKKWWGNNGSGWYKKLSSIIIEHRNIGHDWQFNEQQEELLKQYYHANLLLVECLNSDCYVSREVRQEIEDTLLLPIAEIEQRKRESM